MIVTPVLRGQAAEGILAFFHEYKIRDGHDLFVRRGMRLVCGDGVIVVDHFRNQGHKIPRVRYQYREQESLIELRCNDHYIGLMVVSFDRLPWRIMNGRDRWSNSHYYQQFVHDDFAGVKNELEKLVYQDVV